MSYAKLKKGVTFNSRGYVFRKGIWIDIAKKEDLEYFVNNCSNRIEFAPDGVVPKNDDIKENTDGVISMEGSGKDAIVAPKKEHKPDEVDEEEESELARIREKYNKKREKELDGKSKKKNKKKGDVTDLKYMKEKGKEKSIEE